MKKRFWMFKGFHIALILLIWIAGFGQAVLHLWNWLMPGIFGLHAITFWQAVGMMSLSWLLFSGPRGLMPFGMGMRRHRGGMTPEERERFRKGMERWGERCQGPAASA